ncbi:MAG: DUF1844 domain-containing protein [Acidobacteria bacterium]|nr:DUF1844 domain-containing protein [Acidobacteriota bacterium]
MSENDEAPPVKIKVTDRRLFDMDGNLRDDVSEEAAEEAPPVSQRSESPDTAEEPSAANVSAPEPADSGDEAPAVPASAPVDQPFVEPEATVEAAPAPEAAPPAETDETTEQEVLQFGEEALMRFIEEQYIGGLLALGAMPEPQTGQIVEDLDLAQVRIEVLGILRDRAETSLSMEARKGIDDVIYQLRMAYLQKRKVVKL